MPQWTWREGDAVRDLMEVEFIGLGNLGVDMSRKRQESEITPKLSAWVTGRMEVPYMKTRS